LNNIQIASA